MGPSLVHDDAVTMRRSRPGRSAATAVLGLWFLVAGSNSSATPPPSAPAAAPAPAAAAVLGQPKTVSTPEGSSATVTLKKVSYVALPNDGLQELAVIDLSLTGTSAVPFHYSESNVVFSYATAASAYTDPDNTNVYGSSPTEDYAPYVPPNPLRVGSVARGKTVEGLVILRMSLKAPYALALIDGATTRLAVWGLTSD